METLGNQKLQKSCKKYACESCAYITSRRSSFNKHVLTDKHKIVANGNLLETKSCKKLQKNDSNNLNNNYVCEKCNKEYYNKSGLWKHSKKCNTNILELNKETLIEIIKQNNEFQKDMQKQMFEFMSENLTYNNSVNNINTITNSNNKTFNLQIFLNETCKDAMNIMDFVESVKLQVSDLENVGKVGYIEGISNIIIKNLQALDVEKRPVHCADQKREVMYVKHENIWEKEDETNKKLRKAIRTIAHKNICMFKEFREKYPDCEDYDSKKNSIYNKIVYESMGGKGDNDYEKDTKIIKKIAKEVGIEKG
jgi:hypothetical protein